MSNAKQYVSEDIIRNTANNLFKLLVLASNQEFPCAFVPPRSTSVLNAVCASFGFKSVKGMSVHFSTTPNDSIQAQPVDLNHVFAAQAFNSQWCAILNEYAQDLFFGLLKFGNSNKLNNTLTHLRSATITPEIREAIKTIEWGLFLDRKNAVSDVVKMAVYSQIIYMTGLDHSTNDGHLEDFFAFNPKLKEDAHQWMITLLKLTCNSATKSAFYITYIKLSETSGRPSYHANINTNTSRIVNNQIVRNTFHTPDAKLFFEHSDSRNYLFNKVAEAQIQVLNEIMGDFHNLASPNVEHKDSYGFYGRLGESMELHFYDMVRKEQTDLPKFKNPNEYYWAILLLASHLISHEPERFIYSPAKHILDVYYNFAPQVKEHFTEVHEETFCERVIALANILDRNVKHRKYQDFQIAQFSKSCPETVLIQGVEDLTLEADFNSEDELLQHLINQHTTQSDIKDYMDAHSLSEQEARNKIIQELKDSIHSYSRRDVMRAHQNGESWPTDLGLIKIYS